MSTPTLDRLRAAIDETDAKILELLALRLKHCAEIGDVKKACGMPVRVPEREAAVLDSRITRGNLYYGLNPRFVSLVWEQLLSEARRVQEYE